MLFPETELGPLLLDMTLPIELQNRNDGQGHSFWRTAKDKQTFTDILNTCKREPFRYPTFVTVTRILGAGQRFWDFDSGLRGSWKQLQDAMVFAGWWYDDGPTYITGIYFRQEGSRRSEGPATRVQVWQSGCGVVQPAQKRGPAKGGKGGAGRAKKKKGGVRRKRTPFRRRVR